MIVSPADADGFLRRAHERLRPEPPGPLDPHSNPNGDHAFNPDLMLPAQLARPRSAAVLIPIILHDDEVTVLLTQRAAHLRDHSGQIAFPGGKIDPSDPSPLATALREAEEEIGLQPAQVRSLGYLDPYLSGTGFLVIPVVGLVSPPLDLALNAHEVAEAFEVPLTFLLDPDNHEIHEREWKGRQRRYYAIPFGDRYIWGVTAGIIRNLYERLYGS